MSFLSLDSALRHKAIAEVTKRKARSFLVILAIFIGVFGLTSINIFESKLIAGYAFQQDRSHAPDITVLVDHITPEQGQQLVARTPNVQAVQLQMSALVQWQTNGQPTKLHITAFPHPQQVTLGAYTIIKGRAPGPGEIAMEIEDGSFAPLTLGEMIQIQRGQGNQTLHVVGIAKTAGIGQLKGTGSAQGYMSQSGLQQLLGTMQFNSLTLKVQDFNRVHATAQAVSTQLQDIGVHSQDTQIQSSVGIQVGDAFLTGLFNLVRLLAAGAIIVSCFLIMNTLMTVIAEQTRIIGTMKAMGGTRGIILGSYLLTVFIYSIIGTFPAIIVGILAGYGIALRFATSKFLDLGGFSLEPITLLISIIAGLCVPLLAALFPLLEGTRITVRQALSAYGVTHSASSRKTLLSHHLAWVPQTFWLGFRGLFRKRTQAILTIAALTLSGMTFLAVMTVRYDISQLAFHTYDNYAYDVVSMGATAQPYQPLQQRMQTIKNIAIFESGYLLPASTRWGVIDIVGINPQTQLYKKPMVDGQWLNAQRHNTIVLDTTFLNRAHLAIGDTLQLTDDNGHSANWQIIGSLNDFSPVVGSYGVAYTTLEDLNRFEGHQDLQANELFVQAKENTPDALQRLVTETNSALQASGYDALAQTKQQQIASEDSSAAGIYIIFYVAAVGVAMVGILGLYNALTSSVLERQREIGVWRSLGARAGQITRVFWIEGLTLTILGWLLSSIIGIPLSSVFVSLFSSWLFPIPYAFAPSSLVWMLLIMIVITLLASLGPTQRAGRIRIAEILRYE
ncbi:ABC transporter permease [Tengunoibacter tsumagoiensis]|uniref:ABC transporter permease n=1 Tax=Tengunoibacter tsumagoiensis TaxID=2014871 RepID=A0A402A811_9CHLR|nr:ABC transporter permease [Tengunoibacter tsumagoiensis]GCE15283.1 hypothetical protein KTT_51420 [Tengunoibacter tsumagoiensis]